VAYVIVKAANSPRPGNWILERSIDGEYYQPWQYFAMNDEDCWRLYRVRATIGVPTSLGDDEVICTSRHSKLDPLEGGEVRIFFFIHGILNANRELTDASFIVLEIIRSSLR
jgi:laminin alpha 1/2